MVLSLELLNAFVELSNNWVNVLKVMLLKGLELLNSSEEINEFGDSSAEEVELSEDLVWRELELLTLWHVHKSLFGELVLLQVGSVEVNAALKHWDELLWWILLVVPKDIIGWWSILLAVVTSLESHEVEDVVLAVSDHLVGDLDEKTSHSLVGVVVSGDGVDHLDTVHQGWKGLFDGVWGAVLEWIDELLKGLEILNVVLSLVEVLSDSELKTSPLGGGEVDLGVWLCELIAGVLGGGSEYVINGSAVLALKLL